MADSKKRYAAELSQGSVAQILSDARAALRYSLRELSSVSGVSIAQLKRIEAEQTEPSAEKLVRICIGLGLPPGDVIDFCIQPTSKINELPLEYDGELRSAVAWAETKGLKAARAQERIGQFLRLAMTVLLQALFSSRLDFDMSVKASPCVLFNEAFSKVLSQIEDLSNSERVHLLASLEQRPIDKMKSLGLVTPDILKAVVQLPKVTLPGKKIPRSILRAMMVSAISPT